LIEALLAPCPELLTSLKAVSSLEQAKIESEAEEGDDDSDTGTMP
jgi:hypothetical protein